MTYRFRTISLPVLCLFAFFVFLANAQLSARPQQSVTAKVDWKIMQVPAGMNPSAVANATIGTRLVQSHPA